MPSQLLPAVVLAASFIAVALVAVALERRRARRPRAVEGLAAQAAHLEGINEELQEAQARFRSIIDSSLDAIVITDPRSVITDWNGHAEAIFGWSAEEAVGKTLGETIIPPRYREAHDQGVARYLLTGEGPILNRRIEISALHRDGREFPVELTVAPARTGSALVFSAFIRDITERRQVDQRLAAEHGVTRVLSEGRPLREAAPHVLAAIGEALGWSFGALWVSDWETGDLTCLSTWRASPAELESFEAETRRRRLPKGEGLPGRVMEIGAPVWIEDVTADGGFPRAAAAAAEGLHGAFAFPVRSGAEVLGVIEFFHPAVLRPNAALMELVTAVGSDIGQAVLRVRAEEARDRALLSVQEANEALRERTAEAERSRKVAEEANAAKSEFLANMSHELRTPLNAIVGFADLLGMGIGGDLTDAQRGHLERIRASSRHLLALIEEVLDLAKIEAGRMVVEYEAGAVADTVAGALALVEPQAEAAGIQLENACHGSGVVYVGDEDRVRQILLNLLSNAVKFTPRGGRVSVRCRIVEETEAGTPVGGRGAWAAVEVEDTGIGVSAEDGVTIFEPFVQADQGRTRSYGGTGLGLAISRRLARLMGGDLTLNSEPGRGSCFTLWLPGTPRLEEGSLLPTRRERLSPGFVETGERLRGEVGRLLEEFASRLRADPAIPWAREMSDAELQDHQSALLMDVAQTLVALGQDVGEGFLRDGSDVQRLISVRHGMQRARHHWTEKAVEREFAIVRALVLEARERLAAPGTASEDPLGVVLRMLEQHEQLSIRGLRASQLAAHEEAGAGGYDGAGR